jgi:homocysteine S-methyltransferase
VSSGENFADCIKIASGSEQVVAVGLNCTAPSYVNSLLRIAKSVTDKLLLAYPNKGGIWDAQRKCWLPGSETSDFAEEALHWHKSGAFLIGGCCRTSPDDTRKLKDTLLKKFDFPDT